MDKEKSTYEKNHKSLCAIDLSIDAACFIKDNSLVYQPLDLLYKDETITIIQELLRTEKNKMFLRKYGFFLKQYFPDNSDKMQISYLWAWIKKVSNPQSAQTFEILKYLKSYIFKQDMNFTFQKFGFSILNKKLEILDLLGWIDLHEKLNGSTLKDKTIAISKKEFTRSIFFLASHFKFDQLVKHIDDRNMSSDEPYYKEVKFIYKTIKNYVDQKNTKKSSQELIRMTKTSINFLELEEPYLKFLQFFMSGDFEKHPEKVLSFSGVSFFDRLLFCIRFLHKDVKNLILDYMDNALKEGKIEALCLFTEQPDQAQKILQIYLDKTHDLLTVGLISFIFRELIPGMNFEVFSKSFEKFLDDFYLYNLKGIIRKQLNDLKSQCQFVESDDNFIHENNKKPILVCFYCHRKPNSVQEEVIGVLEDKYTKICFQCRNNLYNCSVCLSVIQLKKLYPEKSTKSIKNVQKEREDDNSNLVLYCLNCQHGGHQNHIKDWFENNDICPISNCKCDCNMINQLFIYNYIKIIINIKWNHKIIQWFKKQIVLTNNVKIVFQTKKKISLYLQKKIHQLIRK